MSSVCRCGRRSLANAQHAPAAAFDLTGYWSSASVLIVNDGASVMEGPVVVIHQNEQFQIDDRRVRVLNLKRSTKPDRLSALRRRCSALGPLGRMWVCLYWSDAGTYGLPCRLSAGSMLDGPGYPLEVYLVPNQR
jgi:hypothetical protein